MPNLPNYDSQQNIRPQTVAPLRDEASQPFQDQQKILGTMQEIAQKWSDANDVMQYTEAKAKHGMAVMDIESRAATDPDFKNSDKYFKELAKARQEATQGIRNQQVASKASIEFDYDTQVAQMKIAGDFRKKQLEYNKVMLKTNLDTLMQKKLSAGDAEALQYDLEIESLLKDNIATGTIDLATADAMVYKSTKAAYENIIYTDPARGIEILKKSNDLSAEDKYKLKNEAQQIQKRDEEFSAWQLKQTQIDGSIQLSDALYNNTLTTAMVREMQQLGQIDSETAAVFDSLAINKKYDIPQSTSLGQPEYFLRLLDASLDNDVKVEKVLNDAAKAYGNGKLGINQYRYFIENAKETFNRQRKGEFTKSKEQNGVISAIQGIKEFASSFFKKSDKPVGEMTNKFFDRYKPGEDPNKVKNDIINEAIVKEKPEISNIPKEGKIMVDKNGNRARVFPDGSYEMIK